MLKQYSRHIHFESILNFRDLGGYKARGGRTVAWRRLFRSSELHHMTGRDITTLKDEIKLNTVIDLRSTGTIKNLGTGAIDDIGVKYYNLPFVLISDSVDDTDKEIFRGFTNSAEMYLYRLSHQEYGKRVVDALEIISNPENHPLVFHCNAGKDRSGLLAAILLSVLGVANEDIIEDYALTGLYLEEFINRWNNDPRTADVHKNLPAYQLVVVPESMALFLAKLNQEYGSVRDYLNEQGADSSLAERLERALLV